MQNYHYSLVTETSKLTIFANVFASRLAPPTRAPSMSLIDMSSAMFSGFTLPPYWMMTSFAVSGPYFASTQPRMKAAISFAWADVAVFPVPMAHTGSYAMTVLSISSAVTSASDALSMSPTAFS